MSNERLKRNQRHIIERIIIRGTLILDTPTCLGNGDPDGPTDMMLVRDSISSHALLTGTSVAGALRNYVHEHEHGYRQDEQNNSLSTSLFGGISEDDDGDQSPLIINDSISSQVPKIELRDGVKINSITRTVDPEARAKYDLELLQAGTKFSLSLELLIEKEDREITLIKVIGRERPLLKTSSFHTFLFKWLAYRYKNKATLLKSLAIALQGLERKQDQNCSEDQKDLKSGEISLGMKKRRGFGRCHVKEWQVWSFNLEDSGDRMAWLLFDRECTNKLPVITNKIADALGVVLDEKEDKRDRFTINATFTLASPLLIRSGQAATGRAPDVVHLKSKRYGKDESVLSGTSLAGVLRHRAERIVNTLEKPTTIIDEIFGPDFSEDKTKEAKASRLIVHESVIKDTTDLVQTRIAIDRFTGGAYHGALFQEQPIFGKGDENLQLEIELRNPEQHEIGLLLLLLKDLWTQDLPVGGSSSVGRGRLQGKEATLMWTKEQKSWKIAQHDLSKNSLEITGSDRQDLENHVKKLVKYTK
ncbi:MULTISPECIES: RAMP superfamily CRISPR-associated protein [Kamptonema]|uniref:RAMP superfamily CRISPR-associated protein n=1 Tax=Kamptonema TaxID=1501433 RepID=UPI0002D4AF08|nr:MULTISPECIES: RAMP superfamily CRISPR-associated protein [Kamptonema]